ncbi:hypothetical protein ACFLTZ_03720 [Chloroflexota bacterium]
MPPIGGYSDDFSTYTGLWTYWGSVYRDDGNGYVVLTEATHGQVGGAGWKTNSSNHSPLITLVPV